MKKHTPVICILDDDKERCLREESALDELIKGRKLNAMGISNFGTCHIARCGMEGRVPAIDVDGNCFVRKIGEELTPEILGEFLDMLVRRGVIKTAE